MHDSLTGLANYSAAIEHLDARLADAETQRAFGGFAVIQLGLDEFKSINDEMDPEAVDEVLKIVSQRATKSLRDSDFIARLGEAEFMIVVPQISDRETAAVVAEKLIKFIAKPYPIKAGEAHVSISIGVSFFPQNGEDRETLMKCADIAMHVAKHAGRNQSCFYEQD
ncbi:MAG: GGDEF domain-containing protein [Pseudomonadota bacterium]